MHRSIGIGRQGTELNMYSIKNSLMMLKNSIIFQGSTSPQLPSDNLNGLVLPSGVGLKNFTMGVNHSSNSVGESPASCTSSPSPHLSSDDNALPSVSTSARSMGKIYQFIFFI